ncbi:melanoma-associated antigen 10-like [Phodopus roborovskii]|uniref:melanoma-associated antigen 10-like n=1 Tax=Phodopus roborovskii TaxID=109678 RepID=UPI0021E410DF|nr:melanoma-associated antigen 10-like [Phodopus roborovskii]
MNKLLVDLRKPISIEMSPDQVWDRIAVLSILLTASFKNAIMCHGQKRQYCNYQGESQAQSKEQEQMHSDLSVAEGEESNNNNSSSSTSPDLPRKMPAGGIPKFHQSPQRALSPPTVMASIPISPSDEASGNQRGEGEGRIVLYHSLSAKVADLVQFLLLKYRLKELTNKTEIIGKIIEDDEQYYNRIFNEASEGLKLVFGINVIEVDPVVHTYALVIALGITYDGMLTNVQGMPKTGLLIIALGVICMNGNRVSENVIWRALNMMGISPMENHYVAGNAKNLFIENFVQEGYLEYNPVPDSDPPHYEFLWGPRAHAETRSEDVIAFLAEMSRIY